MTKIQNEFGTSGFMILNLFRVSYLVLRISDPFEEVKDVH